MDEDELPDLNIGEDTTDNLFCDGRLGLNLPSSHRIYSAEADDKSNVVHIDMRPTPDDHELSHDSHIDDLIAEKLDDIEDDEDIDDMDDDTSVNSDIKLLVTGGFNFGLSGSCDELVDDPGVLLDEMFTTARREQIDFVILTGNLFSNSSPNGITMHKACRKMRSNVYCAFKKDNSTHCLQAPNKPNWHNENIDVQLPVLSLYGHHDRPIVSSNFLTADAPLDILADSKLVNLFDLPTRFDNEDQDDSFKVIPYVFKKGSTTVAIYGMSYFSRFEMKEKLRSQSKSIFEPVNVPKSRKIIKILILHQHQNVKLFNDIISKEGFNIVIWGQSVCSKLSKSDECYHLQPGSSTIRTINRAESAMKNMYKITVNTDQVQIESIKYQNARQVYIEELIIRDVIADDVGLDEFEQTKAITTLIIGAINGILDRITQDGKNQLLPIIQLVVELDGGEFIYPSISVVSLSATFFGRVHNCRTLVTFKRQRSVNKDGNELDNDEIQFDTIDTNQQIIDRTKQNCDEKNLLKLLQSTAMGEVVKSQINGDQNAIKDIIAWQAREARTRANNINLQNSTEDFKSSCQESVQSAVQDLGNDINKWSKEVDLIDLARRPLSLLNISNSAYKNDVSSSQSYETSRTSIETNSTVIKKTSKSKPVVLSSDDEITPPVKKRAPKRPSKQAIEVIKSSSEDESKNVSKKASNVSSNPSISARPARRAAQNKKRFLLSSSSDDEFGEPVARSTQLPRSETSKRQTQTKIRKFLK